MPPKKPVRPAPPEICPICGEDVPPKALACPECGADHLSGWRENADEADLPDDGFDYDSLIHEEFGHSVKPHRTRLIWWLTAVILLAAMIASYVFSR